MEIRFNLTPQALFIALVKGYLIDSVLNALKDFNNQTE